jgi:hypothetical protein
MVGFFIKLFARAFGSQIERGSALGAFLGAALGLIAGAGLAGLLIYKEIVGRDFMVAIYLICPIPLILVGALVGASAGPHRKLATGRSVRLTRYNRAGGTLAIALILAATVLLVAVLTVAPDGVKKPADTQDAWEYRAAVGVIVLMFIGAAIMAVREIWYVDLAEAISVRRLLWVRYYRREQLTLWGFLVRPGEVIQRSFEGRMNCVLQFDDGSTVTVETDGSDSQAIVDVLRVQGG